MNYTCNDSFSFGHIYVFEHRNKKMSFQEKIFYVGSSKVIDERLSYHIRDSQQFKERELYVHLNKHVNVHKFDIYILDHVPIDKILTYERLYYEALIDNKCILYNANKPIPENLDNVNDDDYKFSVNQKLNYFMHRNKSKKMTVEERILNSLKRKIITKKDEPTSDEKSVNKQTCNDKDEELTINEELKQLNESNVILKHSNDFLQKENEILKEMVSKLRIECENMSNDHSQEIKRLKCHFIGIKAPQKQCDICSKNFSVTNFSKHYKICKRKENDQSINHGNKV